MPPGNHVKIPMTFSVPIRCKLAPTHKYIVIVDIMGLIHEIKVSQAKIQIQKVEKGLWNNPYIVYNSTTWPEVEGLYLIELKVSPLTKR